MSTSLTTIMVTAVLSSLTIQINTNKTYSNDSLNLFELSVSIPIKQAELKHADAIIGIWMNAEKNAKFLIYKSNNKYFGKILWGTGGDSKDSKNPNPKLRSRDVIGLVILNNFEYKDQNTWDNGTIYDPKNGKTYDCTLTLANDGNLQVRGYVGVSLFGRTEIWTKIK